MTSCARGSGAFTGVSMARGRIPLSIIALAAALSLGAAAFLGGASEARAEGPVVGTGKAIAGTALLGGEAVAIGMAAFGVKKGWPYLVFPPLVAVGGGIGGYFIEAAAPPAEVPLFLLAGGMALVIPTVIVSLNATVYRAPDGYVDEPVTNKPADLPALPKISKARGSRLAAAPKAAPRVPFSLVDMYDGTLAFGFPAIEVRQVYTQDEIAKYGVTQAREFRVPVFRAVF